MPKKVLGEPKKNIFLTKIVMFGACKTFTGLKNSYFQPKQTSNMAFLLHIGCTDLICPFSAQKVLIGLKKGLFLPKPAVLNNFFTKINIFGYN